MAITSSSTTNTTQFLQYQSFQAELLPGLPHDLALECLLRVPIASHPSIRLVSHFWKSTLSDTSFFSFRRSSNTAENLVFLVQPVSPTPPPPPPPPQTDYEIIVSESPPHHIGDGAKVQGNENGNNNPLLYNLNMYNISHQKWQCLAGITIPAFSQVVVLKEVGKLVALGGWDPTTLENISRVVVVDLASGTWKEGSTMPTARSFFACAAVGPSTVYVAGGHDGQKNALRSAEVYDVLADRWRALPPMAEERDESYGFCLGDDDAEELKHKFCVVSGYGTDSQGRFRSDAEVFDPEKEVWVTVAELWPHSGITPKSTAVVTVEGRKRWWHVIGGEVREFEWVEKQWKGVNMGRVSESINGLWVSSTSVCLVDVGYGKIFVMGNNGENCGGKGVFILEQEYNNTSNNEDKNIKSGGINWRWQHVDTPPSFFGFPFCASHIYI